MLRFVLVAVLAAGGLALGGTARAVVSNINIIVPDGGEFWRGSQEIQWTANGETNDEVYIYHSTDGFSSGELIAGPVPYDMGTQVWDTAMLPEAATYSVKITDTNSPFAAGTSMGTFTIDNTPPTTTASISPVAPDGDNGWYIAQPEVTLACTDALSGCNETYYTLNGGTPVLYSGPFLLPEGETTLAYYSTDNAVDAGGAFNEESLQTFAIDPVKVDLTDPDVAGYTINGLADSVAFNPNVTTLTAEITTTEPVEWVSLQFQEVGNSSRYKIYAVDTAFDGTAISSQGWDGSLSAMGPGPVDGEYELELHITDLAGRDVTMVLSPQTVTVDTQTPTIDSVTLPAADAVYKVGATIPLSFTVTDPAPGTAVTCWYDVINASGTASSTVACASGAAAAPGIDENDLVDGRNEVAFTVADAAGNSVSTAAVSFVFDNDDVLTVSETGGVVGAADFNTIQEAIDKAAAGDTVLVADGTFAESLVIGKALTLQGDGIDTTTVIDGPVKIEADDVTVDGVVIIPGSVLGEVVGVYLQGDLSNVSIANSEIDGNGVAGNPRGVVTTAGSTYSNVVISESIIHDLTTGVYLNPHAGSVAVINTEIYNTVAGIGGLNNATITGNYFHDNGEAIGADSSITGTAYTVEDNRIFDPVNAYGGVTVTAERNWWGTAHAPAIASLTSGDVDFEPYWVDEAMTILSTDDVDEVKVDDDWNDGDTLPAGFYFGYSAFNTIQGGVDAIDVAGGTVAVADGTYSEDVTISKSLTLTGDGYDTTSTIQGQGTGYTGALVIAADDVTVEGFEIIGAGEAAIYVSGARSNITIRDNKAVAATGKTALLMDGGQANHSIENNVFDGNASQLVYINGTPSVSVASTNIDVIGNTFAGTANGPLLGQEADNSEITDNLFSGSTGYAALEIHGDAVTVSGNTLTGAGAGSGILISSFAADAVIDDSVGMNHVNGFATGITVSGASVSVHGTDISGNTAGLTNTTGTTVAAERNWWGAANGPYHAASNPSGSGDEVSDTVTFSPFCTDAECTTFASIGPVTLIDLTVDPASVTTLPGSATVTVTAYDAGGVLVINDTSTKFTLIADNGAAFASNLLTLTADGTTQTTVSKITAGLVNVTANQVGGTAADTAQVDFVGDIVPPALVSHTPADGALEVARTVAPTLTFSEVLRASTVTSAHIQLRRYADDTPVAATVSLAEGGTKVIITPDEQLEPETQYYLAVATAVTDETGNALVSALDATTKADHEFTTVAIQPLVIDEVIVDTGAAEANGSYVDGWHYTYRVTVNTDETDLLVRFADWVNTASSTSTIPAGANMRLLFDVAGGGGLGASVGLTDTDILEGFGTVESYALGNDYADQVRFGATTTTPIDIAGVDLSTREGRQVQFDVYVKLPVGTAPGFYETTYGIKTE